MTIYLIGALVSALLIVYMTFDIEDDFFDNDDKVIAGILILSSWVGVVVMIVAAIEVLIDEGKHK